MRIIVRRLPLVVATVALLFVGLASATNTTAPVSFNTIQELNGQVFRITGAFQFIVAGFHAAGANANATSPCIWTSTTNNGNFAPTCNTSENAGDWVYEVIIQLNLVPKTNTTYNMLVHMNSISNGISFTVPSTALAGTVQNFDLDAGTNIWTSPLIFVTEVY